MDADGLHSIRVTLGVSPSVLCKLARFSLQRMFSTVGIARPLASGTLVATFEQVRHDDEQSV
jgi:hypothetical protein